MPLSKPGGRPRKWFSEACRKRQYAQPCERCGHPTTYGSERGRVEHPLCGSCQRDSQAQAADERAAEFVLLRRQGLLDWQIAELHGTTQSAVATTFHNYRLRGGDVPPSPYRGGAITRGHSRSRRAEHNEAVWAEREARLPELARQGVPLDVIAREFGVTPARVQKIAVVLRKRGVDVPRLRSVVAGTPEGA